MTSDEIEQMKADMEAGTPGPWRASKVNPSRVFGPDNQPVMERDPPFRVSPRYEANARRIARVPELEAEVLRLRDVIAETQEFLRKLNENDPARKMPQIQASVMCIHLERKCCVTLNGGTDD